MKNQYPGKILVTGGAGYIGSHTSAHLIEKGFEIVILDNLSRGYRQLIPPEACFIEGNVQDTELVKDIFKQHKITAMIHFAGYIEVEESVQNPSMYYRNNFYNALQLIEAAVGCGLKHIIFSSTAAVYGEPKVSPISTGAALNPINPYGASKMFTERYIQDLQQTRAADFTFAILRYFNVAGAKLDGSIGQISKRATHLIKIASELAVGKRKSMGIFGSDYATADGTCVRDYIHIEDLARVHRKALEYLLAGGESTTANCGYGCGYSVKEVIATMGKIVGEPLEVKEEGRRAGDPAELVSDPNTAMKTFNWSPKYNDLELICRSALKWEQHLDKKSP